MLLLLYKTLKAVGTFRASPWYEQTYLNFNFDTNSSLNVKTVAINICFLGRQIECNMKLYFFLDKQILV